MKYHNSYLLLFLYLLSNFSLAQKPDDCLTIQRDYAALIDSGIYRYTQAVPKEIAKNTEHHLNFATLESYQQYLKEAYQNVANKNPKATMPCPLVTDTYKQLAQQNNWANTPRVDQLIAPYQLTQNQNANDKAILLIHGLTDSPFSFHDLSPFFYQQGFTVRTLLLPGHGLAPSALLESGYQEWQQATKFAIEQTLKDYKQVYLGGLSTGGALIFNYLMNQETVDEKIKGLFMWSPASKAKNNLAWLAQYVDMIPFVDWVDLDADTDFAKYESFPYKAGAQVHALMSLVVDKHADEKNKLHDIPLFVVASEHDETIDTAYTLAFIKKWKQGSLAEQVHENTLIYYGDREHLPNDLDKVMNVVVPECLPKRLCSDIFDVSHIATTISPENPHYGINGRYRNCGHYLSDVNVYKACKSNEKVFRGEITQYNLEQYLPMHRLTYNPYYQEMLEEITQFLQATK